MVCVSKSMAEGTVSIVVGAVAAIGEAQKTTLDATPATPQSTRRS